MQKCIYCLKDGNSTTFLSREHVIPQCLGSFQPINPTIKGNIVCDKCNQLFSPLEVNFIEDTYEGVYGQRLNLEGRGSVTIRGKLYKINRISGFGEGFFTEMFPFLEAKDGKITSVLKNQIKLNRFRGGYRIFLPTALSSIPKGSKEFKKLSEDLRKLSQKDIAVFAKNDEQMDTIIALLKDYGVQYKEKARHGKQFKPGDKIIIEEEYECSIDIDIARILAKIAFNYFAYCTIQDNKEALLYQAHFNKIREFVHQGKATKLKEIIPSISEKPILKIEDDEKKRLVTHFVTFLAEDNKIVARMTFFGLPPVYKVILGDLPTEMMHSNFGCGHSFNPFSNTIHNLSQAPTLELTLEQIKSSFGLFKRGR